jgi:glycosyltransferase involved in cell wall biosynthesis
LENWPRIGLEAMACGVPIVAPREGGWCEMIDHGETGFLASSAEELGKYGTLLARDEPLRLRIAAQARHKLETELANPDLIWAGWQRLFASLGAAVP